MCHTVELWIQICAIKSLSWYTRTRLAIIGQCCTCPLPSYACLFTMCLRNLTEKLKRQCATSSEICQVYRYMSVWCLNCGSSKQNRQTDKQNLKFPKSSRLLYIALFVLVSRYLGKFVDRLYELQTYTKTIP